MELEQQRFLKKHHRFKSLQLFTMAIPLLLAYQLELSPNEKEDSWILRLAINPLRWQNFLISTKIEHPTNLHINAPIQIQPPIKQPPPQ